MQLTQATHKAGCSNVIEARKQSRRILPYKWKQEPAEK